MPCFYPLDAYQLEDGTIRFHPGGSVGKVNKECKDRAKIRRELKLPCGRCIGCRLEKSRQWATRCMHEAQMHENSSFVTLTYDNDNLKSPSLEYRDFQLFMKRLRKQFPKARFYMCGEYGEQYRRPHFHACLFGVWFPDYELHAVLPSGFRLYVSKRLQQLWPFGFSSFGHVSFESAAYVARYCTKKITGPAAESHYRVVDSETGEVFNLTPEFSHMSLKPGIGYPWFKRFMSDVYPHGHCIIRGKATKPPRYYDELYSEVAPLDFDWLKFERERDALLQGHEGTVDRLRAREIVTRARLVYKFRTIE